MIYVDSNYWIYWLDSRLPEHKHTTGAMREAIEEGILLNNVSLIEVAHYLRRLQKEEFHKIMEMIQNVSTLTLTDLNEEITHLATNLIPDYASKGLGGRDCVIIVTMKLRGANRILTHDQSFRKVEGLGVVDSIPQ